MVESRLPIVVYSSCVIAYTVLSVGYGQSRSPEWAWRMRFEDSTRSKNICYIWAISVLLRLLMPFHVYLGTHRLSLELDVSILGNVSFALWSHQVTSRWNLYKKNHSLSKWPGTVRVKHMPLHREKQRPEETLGQRKSSSFTVSTPYSHFKGPSGYTESRRYC